jgi:YVTN family beta-propeller protein
MGVVYLAYDSRLKRNVAVKLLSPQYASDERFRERFLTESELAASLEHPNVVPIHDAGEVNGQLYLVMRYVPGTDLKRLLHDEGALEPERALAICGALGDALDAAHARGLVHRDVKPSNVLLDANGHLYLTDFGLTRRLVEQAPDFDAGLSLGTPTYVAPEQIEGAELDGRADQYSLACVLYECLTGHQPFPRGSEAATLFAHLEEEPPSVPGLERVLARALAKDPAARYASCAEFVTDARAALGLSEPQRSRWPLTVMAVALLALVAVVTAAVIVARGGTTQDALPGADSVLRIDPTSNSITDRIAVGRQTTGVAVGTDQVWVSSFTDGELWKIDTKTKQQVRLSTQGSPTDVALLGSNAVAANGPQHTLAYIDRDTGTVHVETLPGAGSGILQVASGTVGLWMDDPAARAVQRDPRTGSPRISIRSVATNFASTYKAFDDLAVGEGAVWAAGDAFERRIWRIDPVTESVVATVRVPFVPGQLAAGEHGVWVTSLLGDSIARIDPATNRVVATIEVGRGPTGVTVGGGSVWAASSVDGTVSRIDPKTNEVVATIAVPGSPSAIGAGLGGIWLTTRDRAPVPESGSIRIGVLTDCTGPYAFARDHTLAGAELPLLDRGGTRASSNLFDGVEGTAIDGHPLRLSFGCADGTSGAALLAARRLVEEWGADVLIGPLAGNEGLALQEYARLHADVAFVNGTSSAQQLAPAPNFFSFHTDGAQWMAGVGAYAYRDLGWRRAVTIANVDDDLFNWSQVAGFAAEFCALGGTIVQRAWVPAETQDYSGVVARLPRHGVDGFVVVTGGQAAVALARGYPGLPRSLDRRLIIGVLTPGPELAQLGSRTRGVVFGNGVQQQHGNAYTKRLLRTFPKLPPYLVGTAFDVFYFDAMVATLKALDSIAGEVGNPRRLLAAMGRVQLNTPQGHTSLDRDRQGIARNYLLALQTGSKPASILRTIPHVARTFGGYFGPSDPPPSKSSPPCKHGHPPPWARR